MRSFFTAILLLVLLFQFNTSRAGKCTGSAYCSACKNCSYCKHCNGGGGTCGVCGGGDNYKASRNSNSSYGATMPDDKSTNANSASSYEPASSFVNTKSSYHYPDKEKEGSHILTWVVIVLIVLYLLGRRKIKSQT